MKKTVLTFLATIFLITNSFAAGSSGGDSSSSASKSNYEKAVSHIKKAKKFEKKGFPNKKQEAWKYTSLAKILKSDYGIFPKKEVTIELKDVQKYFIYEIDTYKIVFIDGIYSPFLSDTTHDGLDVCLLSAALTNPKYKSLINKYFNKISDKKDSLTLLNTSFSIEGAYIYLPKSVTAEKPIEIMHFSTGKQGDFFLQPRNLIIVEENAEVQILERHQSLSNHRPFTNSVTEIYAKDSSRMDIKIKKT